MGNSDAATMDSPKWGLDFASVKTTPEAEQRRLYLKPKQKPTSAKPCKKRQGR